MFNGHIKICEVVNGISTTIIDDNNITTYGIRSSLASILTGEENGRTEDFNLAYIQIGTDRIPFEGKTFSSTFFSLSAPLTEGVIGADSENNMTSLYTLLAFSGSTEVRFSAEPASGFVIKPSNSKSILLSIPQYCKTKKYTESFDIRLVLDKGSCNGVSITELGLFLKNPKGYTQDVPMMVAYKKFATPIVKSSDREIIIDWAIGTLGFTNTIDKVHSGGYTPEFAFNYEPLIANAPPSVVELSPGLIAGAFSGVIEGYSGPGGGATPSWVEAGMIWYWPPNPLEPGFGLGHIRYGWQYMGLGYWIYVGNTPQPYTGPTGGGWPTYI